MERLKEELRSLAYEVVARYRGEVIEGLYEGFVAQFKKKNGDTIAIQFAWYVTSCCFEFLGVLENDEPKTEQYKDDSRVRTLRHSLNSDYEKKLKQKDLSNYYRKGICFR